jgi:rod shape-determining protein MreC
VRKRFDQARPFAALGIAVAAWMVLPVVAKTFLRAGFYELTAPVTVAASRVRDLQDYWSLRLHSDSSLIEAGRDLARAAAAGDIAARQNVELRAEVARLEKEFNLPPVPGFRYEAARVARRDFSGWWQRMTIRKGADYGIPVGAPVVFAGGLVGRVAEVHAYASEVELIGSPELRLAALIEGDTRPVSYQGGDNPLFGPAQGEIDFVPLDIAATPAAPRRLVTSGLGGVFPPGLAIGLVTQVSPSPDGLFKTGEVRLDPRLSEITEVSVLVPTVPPVGIGK